MTRTLTTTACAALLLLAACGDEGDATSSTAAESTTTTAVESSFPVVVTAENGDVDIASRPLRIVSLSASLTELLYAIGAGEQIVAVDKYSDFPAGAPLTDLSGFRPNVEAIAGYEPDLVVVANDRDGIVDALGAVGLPTLLLSSADGLDQVYEEIAVLGTATGHPDEAADLTAQLRSDLEDITASVRDREAPLRYFYELSDGLHSVTSDTFIGELLGLAGLTSIADSAADTAGGFPQLSAEYVLEADPDIIFLAHTDGTGQDPSEVAGRPGWADLAAVRSGAVIVLDADISSRWGPRIVDLLRAVVDATSSTSR